MSLSTSQALQGSCFFKMDFAHYLEDDFTQNPESFISQLDSLNDLETCLFQIGNKLDQVELELMKEVASQSTTFHSALSTMQELRDSMQCLSSTTEQIASQLNDFQTKSELNTHELNVLYSRQKNILSLQSELENVSAILKLRNKIQDLVNKSSFDEALFLIKKARKEIDEKYPGLQAFTNLTEELEEMKVALEKLKSAPFEPAQT